MADTTTEKVRQLLRPTDDLGWDKEVMALDRTEAVPILIRILNDEQEKQYTRRQAALALGLLRDDRAIDALAQALDADDRVLRGQAAQALGQFPLLNNERVQQLIQHLQDEDYFVRECSAKALGQLRRLDAVPALELMSTADDVQSNREVAEMAIETIRTQTT